MDGGRRPVRAQPGQQPGLRATGRRREDDRVEPDGAVGGLPEELGRRLELAGGADDPATPDVDDVRSPTGLNERSGDLTDECLALGPIGGRGLVDRRPEQLVQPTARIRRVGRRPGQDEVDVETGDRPGRRRQAAVVRPASAGGHEAVGAGGQRGADERLEVAQLVAAERERQEVFALDPELGATTERRRQPNQRGDRRRAAGQREARQVGRRRRHARSVAVRVRPYHRHPRERRAGWPFA